MSTLDNKDKSTPKDAQVMIAILKDMGVNEFEPRVVNQLLEFSYRYVTTILEDSRVLSNHAKKKAIDIDDVKLSVQMFADQNLTSPPSREILLEMARNKNCTTLPVPKPSSGAMKLPPDRHCITACNYRLKSKFKSVKDSGRAGYSAKSIKKPPTKFSPNSGGVAGNTTPVFKIQVPPGVQIGESPSNSESNKRKREDDL